MISRRTFAKYSGLSLLGASASGWLPQLAAQAQASATPHKRCILLWMSGGPSQMETFDPKPGHENGGPTQAIDTNVPGIQISEHLPQVAKVMNHLAPIRSMSTKEGDHTRATFFMRTGYLPPTMPSQALSRGDRNVQCGCDTLSAEATDSSAVSAGFTSAGRCCRR
jgi:hypothetical protein